MKTPAEQARERADAIVRDRGQWSEPLTWEEVAALLEDLDRTDEEYLHWESVCRAVRSVKMSATARRALAEAFGVDIEDVTPRVVA